MAAAQKEPKERAVGEVFAIGRRKFETLENKQGLCFPGDSTEYCAFMRNPCGPHTEQGTCLPGERADGRHVAFREIKQKPRKTAT